MSQDRLAELLGIKALSLRKMFLGEKGIPKEKIKNIFPNLTYKIDEYRYVLSCPLCGFGAVTNNRNDVKIVKCSQCQCFVAGKTMSEVASKWNERFNEISFDMYDTASCALCGGLATSNDQASIVCSKCGFTLCTKFGKSLSWETILKMWNRRYKNKTLLKGK